MTRAFGFKNLKERGGFLKTKSFSRNTRGQVIFLKLRNKTRKIFFLKLGFFEIFLLNLLVHFKISIES